MDVCGRRGVEAGLMASGQRTGESFPMVKALNIDVQQLLFNHFK